MARMKTSGTLEERVARMAHTLNINLRAAKQRDYADFAEFKFIEKQLLQTGYASPETRKRQRQAEQEGTRTITLAHELKPDALKRRYTQEQLKEYEQVLTSALQKADFLKGRKGAREYDQRAGVFKERIERTTGETIDKTKVYDLVKLQSDGIWKRMKEELGFSSSQIINLVQAKRGKVVADRFNEIMKLYDQTGLPYSKNDVIKYIMGEINLKQVVERNIKLYGIEVIPLETLKQYNINAEFYKNL